MSDYAVQSNLKYDLKYDVIYLKRRDEIIEALPEAIKTDKVKAAAELDFYPEELKPFMGLTISGLPVSWRYKSDKDIFMMKFALEKNASSIEVPMKVNWFDIFSPEHKKAMANMLLLGASSRPAYTPEPDTGMETDDEDDDYDDEYEEEENSEAWEDEAFTETAVIYLKTPAEMGIAQDVFSAGNFTGSDYYPDTLKAYAGLTVSIEVNEYADSVEDNEGNTVFHKHNKLIITVAPQNNIIIDIPLPDAPEDPEADPAHLDFDYTNWFSLFCVVIETHGDHLSGLVSGLDYLNSMNMTPQVEQIWDEEPQKCCEEPQKKEEPKANDEFPAIGELFLAQLKGYKDMNISETEYYCKAFTLSEYYPDDLLVIPGTCLEACFIHQDMVVVKYNGKEYDIAKDFIKVFSGATVTKADPLASLATFKKDKPKGIKDKEEFSFVEFPSVNERITGYRFVETATDLIEMLDKKFHISKFSLALIDKGITSDFIMVTGFLAGKTECELSIDLLDMLMFYQMDSELFVSFKDQGGQKTEGVSAADAKLTAEDLYLKEFADDFDQDMFSGAGLRRAVLDINPYVTSVKLVKQW